MTLAFTCDLDMRIRPRFLSNLRNYKAGSSWSSFHADRHRNTSLL